MPFNLTFQPEAAEQLHDLEHDDDKRDLKKLDKVRRCLGLLETNPRYPGLNCHIYTTLQGPNGESVWEAYVENNTPTAWRVFWHYEPDRAEITILAITPHP